MPIQDVPPQELVIPFGDGKYRFRLGLLQLAELQTKTGVGLGALHARVLQGRYFKVGDEAGESIGDPREGAWHIQDLTETVRLALIGGGKGWLPDGTEVKVSPVMAQDLITAYVLDRPLSEAWSLAAAILYCLIEGFKPPPGSKAPKKTAAPTKTAGSTTPGP